ncbi:MAG: ribonuclease PH, partial [Burkholderiaceae bacterium]
MNDYKRKNGRLVDQIREVSFERNFVSNSDGSVLISQGNTRVLCTANIENKCPAWLKGIDKGWITAEYSMLPGSANNRINREAVKGKQSGRTLEIQRLIGRTLRSSLDL